MSIAIFRDQKSFMTYFGQHASPETARLYYDLVREEFSELEVAMAAHQQSPSHETVTEIADACIDLVYVVSGLLHGLGLDPQPLWDEVHRSNIAKIKHACGTCETKGVVDIEGVEITCPQCGGSGYHYEVRRRADGKVLKPDGWQPPNLLPLVTMMLGHR